MTTKRLAPRARSWTGRGVWTPALGAALLVWGGEGLGAFPNPEGDGRVTAVEARTCWDETMTFVVHRKFDRYQNASLHGASDAVLAQAGKTVRSPQHSVLGASAHAPETQAPTVQEALDTLMEALTTARAITNNRVRALVLGKDCRSVGGSR